MIESRQIAIVVVAYNRPAALKRILGSLDAADYTGYSNVPLVISIDKSDVSEVTKIASEFEWRHGKKEIIAHSKNLGLKKHIICCGDLTNKYDNVIVLEDDLYVSPYFYDYAAQALQFYGDDDRIGGISLYAIDFNDHAIAPFIPLQDGYDNYFMQVPASLGQLWTAKHWSGFKEYFLSSKAPLKQEDPVPEKVIAWGESSWKKYYYKYLAITGKFFVYPRISLTTNFGDAGTHFPSDTSKFQVSLTMGKRKYNFSTFDSSFVKYDVYHELLASSVKQMNQSISRYDFECDLYGEKSLSRVRSPYLLSIKECRKPIASFACTMLPQELNVCLVIKGGYFHLGRVEDFYVTEDYNNPKKVMNPVYGKISTYQVRAKAYNDAIENFH